MNNETEHTTTQPSNGPVVVDLGKKKKKAVKSLKRGEGELVEDISRAISELQQSGVVSPSAAPVVVIVEKKPKQCWDTWM